MLVIIITEHQIRKHQLSFFIPFPFPFDLTFKIVPLRIYPTIKYTGVTALYDRDNHAPAVFEVFREKNVPSLQVQLVALAVPLAIFLGIVVVQIRTIAKLGCEVALKLLNANTAYPQSSSHFEVSPSVSPNLIQFFPFAFPPRTLSQLKCPQRIGNHTL